MLKRIVEEWAGYLLVAVAAAVLVALLWVQRDRAIAEGAVARAEIRRLAGDVRRLRVDSVRLADQYRADTVQLTRWRTKWDTVATTVDRWKYDTLRVVEYVRVADSTIAACTDALQTCEARVANAEGRAAKYDSLYQATKKRVPSKMRRLGQGIRDGAVAVGMWEILRAVTRP